MMADILMQAQDEFGDMTEQEARQLTDEIKTQADVMWGLILTAHDRKAYRALGYATWPEYLAAEFEMSRSRSYQLLDQARVIKEIQAATGEMSTKVDISEREARDIKPVLDRVTERIREEVATVAPEQARAIVDQIIKEERGKQLAVVEGQRAARTLAEEFPALATVDKEDDAQTQTMYGLYEALETIAGMPDAEVAKRWVKPYQAKYIELVPKALGWLQRFSEVQA